MQFKKKKRLEYWNDFTKLNDHTKLHAFDTSKVGTTSIGLVTIVINK